MEELLSEVSDWEALVKLINAHGIIALASYNIKIADLENLVPEDALAILENGRMQSMIRNFWLTERWKEVNIILTNAGINHILLKGMALEHTVYGSKGLRQMNDNDILIHPDHAITAWELLQKNGFVQQPLKSPLFRKMIFSIGRHLPPLSKEGYTLEIHNRLFENENSGKGDNNPFRNIEEITIAGEKALILSNEWQLKHLTGHFEYHMIGGECQLRLYADIVLLDKMSKIQFPDIFILNPIQSKNRDFRRTAYKRTVVSVPAKYRLRFIIGDTFPSVSWMRKRYNCSTFKAIAYYPQRIGKILWLV